MNCSCCARAAYCHFYTCCHDTVQYEKPAIVLQRLENLDIPAIRPLAGVCLPMLTGYSLAALGLLPTSSAVYDVVATWMVPLAVALLLCETDVREYVG